MQIFSLLSLLLTCLTLASGQELFDRPFIIGASVSDGYEHTEILGGPKSDALALDRYLNRAIAEPEIKFTNIAKRFSFLYPLGISHKQVTETLARKPTVVIAVDQLFWQLYGNFSSPENRIKTFKAALAKLDPITCPLVIGNIPDASHSINKMLAASQIPKLEIIKKANLILEEWVSKRKQTVILDLAQFMRLSVANKEIKLKHITYPEGATRKFLQSDMLHPTPEGAEAISYAVVDALQSIGELEKSDIKLPAKSHPDK